MTAMYLGTILLERNRWRKEREPSWFPDEGWCHRFAEAGFSGMELWENHWKLGSPMARAALIESPCPVRVFNWYGSPGRAEEEGALLVALEALGEGVRGVKFNVAQDEEMARAQAKAVPKLLSRMPPGVGLWCECHGGTAAETPEGAAWFFEEWPEGVGAIVHPFTQAGLDRWWELLGARIVHLHLQARTSEGGWLQPVPGMRGVDEGAAFLAAQGFAGSATVEFVAGMGEEREGPEV
ncbi:MAG: hypothetical protein SNJ84_04960, partial [Verrucomicrobiia bacterium]